MIRKVIGLEDIKIGSIIRYNNNPWFIVKNIQGRDRAYITLEGINKTPTNGFDMQGWHYGGPDSHLFEILIEKVIKNMPKEEI